MKTLILHNASSVLLLYKKEKIKQTPGESIIFSINGALELITKREKLTEDF